MTVDEAFEVVQQVLQQINGANSALRTLPDQADDLEEFFAFYDEDEQQAVLERCRKAARAFVSAWGQVKGSADNEKLYIRELRGPVARLSQSLKVGDPAFDTAPVEAVLAAVTLTPTKRPTPQAPKAGAARAVVDLFGFLARSPKDRALLDTIAAKAIEVKKKSGSAEISFETTVVKCAKPAKPAKGVPTSYAAIASVFGSVLWKHGGATMGFLGITKTGALAKGTWEPEALEEGDNEVFLAALKKAKLKPSAIQSAFACGSNWILFDPTRLAKNGEPALAFVSHGDCAWVPVKSADGHDASGVLLRLMAWSLAGERGVFKEIFA